MPLMTAKFLNFHCMFLIFIKFGLKFVYNFNQTGRSKGKKRQLCWAMLQTIPGSLYLTTMKF